MPPSLAPAEPAEPPPAAAGDCHICRYGRRIENPRGSVFTLCRRSRLDPSYPKYPPLPVRNCPGLEARDPSGP